jgi:hypothetical protein
MEGNKYLCSNSISTEVPTKGVIMKPERRMVAQAVAEGIIGEEHLTLSEINEMIGILSDVSIHQGLEDAKERGKIVTQDGDNEWIH